MTSFLQSPAWQAFQEALGRPTYTDSGDTWSYVAILETGTFNKRLYVPGGPVCTDAAGFDAALDSLRQVASRVGATFIRVDPPRSITGDELRARGFFQMTYQQLQPAHTQIINLSPPDTDLLAQMSQNSRNLTRNYANKGLVIRTTNDPADITILTSLLSGVASRSHMTPHSNEYFRVQAETLLPPGAATLYIAEYHHSPIAAALVCDSDDTRSYVHAAADDTYRKLSAGTALVGQMILDAKHAGLAWFDLYGIADTDDPQHPWAGFTRFKKSFGGQTVASPGTWDLPLHRNQYWLYRAYQTLYRWVRQRKAG